MMHITGFVRYYGMHSCQLYCGMAGHHQTHGKQYISALLRPLNYEVKRCIHANINIWNISSPSHLRYKIEPPYIWKEELGQTLMLAFVSHKSELSENGTGTQWKFKPKFQNTHNGHMWLKWLAYLKKKVAFPPPL